MIICLHFYPSIFLVASLACAESPAFAMEPRPAIEKYYQATAEILAPRNDANESR